MRERRPVSPFPCTEAEFWSQHASALSLGSHRATGTAPEGPQALFFFHLSSVGIGIRGWTEQQVPGPMRPCQVASENFAQLIGQTVPRSAVTPEETIKWWVKLGPSLSMVHRIPFLSHSRCLGKLPWTTPQRSTGITTFRPSPKLCCSSSGGSLRTGAHKHICMMQLYGLDIEWAETLQGSGQGENQCWIFLSNWKAGHFTEIYIFPSSSHWHSCW